MTFGALDTGANVRSVVESHVRLVKKSVNPLPGQIFTALGVISQQLNSLIGSVADVFMTTHAKVDAWNSSARPARSSGVAFCAFDSDFVDGVNLVRKIDRLLQSGLDA
jgi:hypothetical protein